MMLDALLGTLEDGSTPQVQYPQAQSRSFPVGADASIPFKLKNSAAAAVNLTGIVSLTFCIRKDPTDVDPTVSRGAVITNAVSGDARFDFVPADTQNLKPGNYFFDIWLVDASNKRHRVLTLSFFVLAKPVGRVTDGLTPPLTYVQKVEGFVDFSNEEIKEITFGGGVQFLGDYNVLLTPYLSEAAGPVVFNIIPRAADVGTTTHPANKKPDGFAIKAGVPVTARCRYVAWQGP